MGGLLTSGKDLGYFNFILSPQRVLDAEEAGEAEAKDQKDPQKAR